MTSGRGFTRPKYPHASSMLTRNHKKTRIEWPGISRIAVWLKRSHPNLRLVTLCHWPGSLCNGPSLAFTSISGIYNHHLPSVGYVRKSAIARWTQRHHRLSEVCNRVDEAERQPPIANSLFRYHWPATTKHSFGSVHTNNATWGMRS